MVAYRKFVIRGLLALAGVVVLVVLVFFIIQRQLVQPAPAGAPVNTSAPPTPTNTEVITPTELDLTEVGVEERPVLPPTTASTERIYLRDLPLTDSQRSLAGTFGIDVETYYFTPETISCAEQTLGQERFTAIKNGGTPTFWEATQMLGCL